MAEKCVVILIISWQSVQVIQAQNLFNLIIGLINTVHKTKQNTKLEQSYLSHLSYKLWTLTTKYYYSPAQAKSKGAYCHSSAEAQSKAKLGLDTIIGEKYNKK